MLPIDFMQDPKYVLLVDLELQEQKMGNGIVLQCFTACRDLGLKFKGQVLKAHWESEYRY